MAKHLVIAESGTRRLPSATVKVYTEDTSKADSGFSDSDLATIYSDAAMTTAIDQAASPLTTDSLGEVVFYMPSMSFVMIEYAKTGYGTRIERQIDILGSDP